MKIRCIEHVDEFGPNERTFWVEVDEVPIEFIKKAKEIDGENFLETCFEICVIKTEYGWFICEDEPGYELFYIDNEGDKNWMPYTLSETEVHDAVEYCMNELEKEE